MHDEFAEDGGAPENTLGQGAPFAAPDHPASSSPSVVLIVEDEEPIAAAIAMVVEDAGYEPVVASNGQEALAVLGVRQAALVLTDMMMPRMNGIQLIAALRKQTAHGRGMPPVVLMTAGGPLRVREAGADAILWKPFGIEQLEMLLTRFLFNPSLAH